MRGFILKNTALKLLVLAAVLTLCIAVAAAQDSVSRTLTPGIPAVGTLDDENLAQMYTFDGAAGQVVRLSLTSGPGVAVLVADEDGQPLERMSAGDGSGQTERELPLITLPTDGRYYVTIFVYSDSFVVSEGAFILALNLEDSADVEATNTPEPVETTVAAEETATVVPSTPAASDTGFTEPGQIVTTTGMQVTLTWDNTADLNLQVRDPIGGSLFWDSRTAANGGSFGFDANGLCEVLTNEPVETASWPGGVLATGSYEILVYYRSACENEGQTAFTVNVVVDGEALEPITGTLLPPVPNQDQVYISRFVIQSDGSIVQGEGSVYLDVLAEAPQNLPPAVPIARGEVAADFITNQRPYAVYTFAAEANDLISVNLTATAGSLDTLLFVLGPNGNVVYSNDDVEFGVTDSALNNIQLGVTGQYTIVATRYGQAVGGTEGTYELLLAGPTGELPPEVQALNLPAGDIEITLIWSTNADLQLLVRDPALDSVFDDTPAIPSGGRLVAAGNVNCTQAATTQPVSYVYWPTGFLRAGTYEVDVWYQNDCGDPSPVNFTLIVKVLGEVVFYDSVRPLPGDQYVSSFNIDVNRQVNVYGGSIMTITTLDYRSLLPTAPTVESGQPVRGNLSFENPFDVYVFEGEVGEVINVAMNATAGNLDTMLFIIDPNGTVLRVNDDAVVGEVTNSVIADLSLAQDGQYAILATRFGLLYGATTGAYELTLTLRN